MSQDIHTHLEKLKTELNKLEPAVKHLQQADENASALISAVSTIHKEYSKHLQAIEKLLVDSNKDHHKQISKDILDSTNKLNDLGEKITKSFKSVEKEVKDLLDEYKFLSSQTEKLVNKIDKVDFPTRLDKLDSTVSSINQGLQNTQTRIGDLERNIKDDIQAKAKDVISKVDSTESNLKQQVFNVNLSLIVWQFCIIFHNFKTEKNQHSSWVYKNDTTELRVLKHILD